MAAAALVAAAPAAAAEAQALLEHSEMSVSSEMERSSDGGSEDEALVAVDPMALVRDSLAARSLEASASSRRKHDGTSTSEEPATKKIRSSSSSCSTRATLDQSGGASEPAALTERSASELGTHGQRAAAGEDACTENQDGELEVAKHQQASEEAELHGASDNRSDAPELAARDRSDAPELAARDRGDAPELAARDRGDAPELATPRADAGDLRFETPPGPRTAAVQSQPRDPGGNSAGSAAFVPRLALAEFDEAYTSISSGRGKRGVVIGEGTEGRVEAIQECASGELFAVKWLKRAGHATEELQMIEKLVRMVWQS